MEIKVGDRVAISNPMSRFNGLVGTAIEYQEDCGFFVVHLGLIGKVTQHSSMLIKVKK